jgi:DNA-binding MarR family transcriptional regulator
MRSSPDPDLPADGGDPDVVAVERAMVRIRRSVARRTFSRVLRERGDDDADLAHVPVVDVVEEGGEEEGEPATVGVVGERLGIDPSRASRVVAAAVAAGMVKRVAAERDGRRIGLVLTDAGRALLRTTRAQRQRWMAAGMAGWSADDRHRFAELFTRFVDTLPMPGGPVPGATEDDGM